MATKNIFHVKGGAAKPGGRTYTARSLDPVTAVKEANGHFKPRATHGSGRWVPRADMTGPDELGNLYYHADWVLDKEIN